MARMPRERSPDSTLALLADPYGFIAKRCRRHRSDVFAARLLLRRTLCMSGPAAAELFYDPGCFIRSGAAPEPVRATLFGEGGVQGLDDEAHRHRKRTFMSLMAPERIAQLAGLVDQEWQAAAERWRSRERVVLYDELHELLTRAVCAWTGVPLAESEVPQRARDLAALFDLAGAHGPGHFRARRARHRAEDWIAQLVARIRTGELAVMPEGAAQVIASHRDLNGELLAPRIAAVEILNVLRPTVAVSVYIVFVAHALHLHPECRERLLDGDQAYAECFVQEVRRFYPFFPAVMARVRQDFEWRGFRFRRGTRVMLDLYGTDRDPRTWDAPEEFRPERFRARIGNPFDFIPQGGGDPRVNHRCPGEWITVALMQDAARILAGRLAYEVPAQDLRIDHARLPALPRDRFVIARVRGIARA